MCEILSSISSSDRTTFSRQLIGKDFSGGVVSTSKLPEKTFSTSQLGRQYCLNQVAYLVDNVFYIDDQARLCQPSADQMRLVI